MSQIAILGGTFDPPHFGHLILAEQACDQLHVERVLWVPAAHPPHKQGEHYTGVDHRLEMLRLALVDNPCFAISLIDVNRPAPHYSVDMLSFLRHEYAGTELLFLMGGDSLRDLSTWREPARLLKLAHLVVMRRPGDNLNLIASEEIIPGIKDRVTLLDTPLIEISAHDIRQRVQGGRSIRYLVPEPVRAYIVRSNLYHSTPR